jgi:lysyl oxidase-like protein 2/3/4
MVYHSGRWGSVCDDGWSLQAAHITCQTLGWPYALGYTTQSHFGRPHDEFDIWLDNVQCSGAEWHLLDCRAEPWGEHDCDQREAAGVFCAPTPDFKPVRARPRHLADANVPDFKFQALPKRTTVTPSTTTTRATSAATTVPFVQFVGGEVELDEDGQPRAVLLPSRVDRRHNDVLKQTLLLGQRDQPHVHRPEKYAVRLSGGRNSDEGRVQIRVPGGGGGWGTVCSDHWSVLEARVVCHQLGKGYARTAMRGGFFGGEDEAKLAGGIRCDGTEEAVHECYHTQLGDVTCEKSELVAGVVCTDALPDLVPNATLIASSSYLEDRPLYYLECAIEENCASESAYNIKDTRTDWHIHRRRLLRFSSSTWNFGTADFRPFRSKGDWEWHLCHMHYHSMGVFASYDLLDHKGNRVAQGHKASFCLEDVQCTTGVTKKYECKNLGDQGISVGCADDYLHDIDCQWIDVTDVLPGNYIFKMHINPDLLVAELSYDNNAVTCELSYTGSNIVMDKCTLGRG